MNPELKPRAGGCWPGAGLDSDSTGHDTSPIVSHLRAGVDTETVGLGTTGRRIPVPPPAPWSSTPGAVTHSPPPQDNPAAMRHESRSESLDQPAIPDVTSGVQGLTILQGSWSHDRVLNADTKRTGPVCGNPDDGLASTALHHVSADTCTQARGIECSRDCLHCRCRFQQLSWPPPLLLPYWIHSSISGSKSRFFTSHSSDDAASRLTPQPETRTQQDDRRSVFHQMDFSGGDRTLKSSVLDPHGKREDSNPCQTSNSELEMRENSVDPRTESKRDMCRKPTSPAAMPGRTKLELLRRASRSQEPDVFHSLVLMITCLVLLLPVPRVGATETTSGEFSFAII